jgi:hypothetical protein
MKWIAQTFETVRIEGGFSVNIVTIDQTTPMKPPKIGSAALASNDKIIE